jgi:hypothetical protein
MNHVLIKFLPIILQQLSGPLRSMILNFLDDMEEAAAKTPNPFDDFGVELLRSLMGSKLEKEYRQIKLDLDK